MLSVLTGMKNNLHKLVSWWIGLKSMMAFASIDDLWKILDVSQ
jgi:hypothetical protein